MFVKAGATKNARAKLNLQFVSVLEKGRKEPRGDHTSSWWQQKDPPQRHDISGGIPLSSKSSRLGPTSNRKCQRRCMSRQLHPSPVRQQLPSEGWHSLEPCQQLIYVMCDSSARHTVDFGDIVTMGCHQPSDSKVEYHANHCTGKQKESSANPIDNGKHKAGGNKKDDILDDRRGQSRIARHSSHFENVDNVVHRHVAAEKLLPHLHTRASKGTFPDFRTEQAKPRDVLGLFSDACSFLDYSTRVSGSDTMVLMGEDIPSAYSASTIGLLRSPLPCNKANVSKHSSHRSFDASHLGLSGNKRRAPNRINAGIPSTPQATLNAAGPLIPLAQP